MFVASDECVVLLPQWRTRAWVKHVADAVAASSGTCGAQCAHIPGRNFGSDETLSSSSQAGVAVTPLAEHRRFCSQAGLLTHLRQASDAFPYRLRRYSAYVRGRANVLTHSGVRLTAAGLSGICTRFPFKHGAMAAHLFTPQSYDFPSNYQRKISVIRSPFPNLAEKHEPNLIFG